MVVAGEQRTGDVELKWNMELHALTGHYQTLSLSLPFSSLSVSALRPPNVIAAARGRARAPRPNLAREPVPGLVKTQNEGRPARQRRPFPPPLRRRETFSTAPSTASIVCCRPSTLNCSQLQLWRAIPHPDAASQDPVHQQQTRTVGTMSKLSRFFGFERHRHEGHRSSDRHSWLHEEETRKS